ncbi:MAG: hypothetical protein PHE88_02665 [Elusimicrobia bacterium]|nr:hypothetical protein [Elusimicrobiota bacterium]
MGFSRFAGFLCIVPSVMMLVASFFVLFAVGKTESKGLKMYGRIIAVLLWIAVAICISAGIFVCCKNRCPMMPCDNAAGIEKESSCIPGKDMNKVRPMMKKDMSVKKELQQPVKK